MTDSIESVMALSDGLMIVDVIGGESINFSLSFACPDCGISIEEVEPRAFPLITHLEPVRTALDWGIRWSLTKT